MRSFGIWWMELFIILTMGLKPSPLGDSFRIFVFFVAIAVMENYRTSSYSRFDIKYHFVWVTKYRKQVLTGEVGLRVRDLVRETCQALEIEILQGAVSRDHVHVLLSCPPNLSPSKIMQRLKGANVPQDHAGVQAHSASILGTAFFGLVATSSPRVVT